MLSTYLMARKRRPASSSIPPDGDYLVTTTWRALLDATTTVGRVITPWVAAVPRLARREIMARGNHCRPNWFATACRPTKEYGRDGRWSRCAPGRG